MPEEIAAILEREALRGAYDARPAYQRNDYLGWIGRAAQAQTRMRRIDQMLTELRAGSGYMGMPWAAGGRRGKGPPEGTAAAQDAL